MRNCDDFSIFLRAFINELWLAKKKKERKKEKKKERKKEGQNGDFCSGISRLHERLGELGG